ncbi:hypothetical protein Moror_16752 [Moniliophthora roreri MCA 2997]|uniref:Uncharacterized protein n=2 Tax=Moniliophthora roreri TaxID=221103 RepID=V2WJR2_MONRO|nr:hypothetical protein Moror_16752 [Moniliophthora roreri MCA 2997]
MCTSNFKAYLHGHIADFIQYAKLDAPIPCWQARDGDVWCQSIADSAAIIVSLSDTLIVRVEQETLEDEWEFPQSVYPVAGKEAQDIGLVYDIVGHIFLNSTHYVAWSLATTDTPTRVKGVFFYDGQGVNAGKPEYSVKESGGVAKSLSSWNIPMPKNYKDYWTLMVLYKLQGGQKAQE